MFQIRFPHLERFAPPTEASSTDGYATPRTRVSAGQRLLGNRY